jgi:hypothetical protein
LGFFVVRSCFFNGDLGIEFILYIITCNQYAGEFASSKKKFDFAAEPGAGIKTPFGNYPGLV